MCEPLQMVEKNPFCLFQNINQEFEVKIWVTDDAECSYNQRPQEGAKLSYG